jgi:putative peptide zinc metalloprotease protein
VRRGELLGYVVGEGASRVRVALPHARVAQVRDRTRAVAVRLVRAREQVLPAAIARIVPAATERLPAAALGTSAGGPHPVDPADPEGVRTLEPVFVVDVELAPGAAPPEIGGRATVRFDHAAEPVAAQGWRVLRRVFLRRIGV